jgi:hypothetical protein
MQRTVLQGYGNRPVVGPDGRIVCCSAGYEAINILGIQNTDAFPPTVDLVQVVYGNAGLELINLPVTHKYWTEPSKFWQTATEYIPALRQNHRIESWARGGWVFCFSVTPEQFD